MVDLADGNQEFYISGTAAKNVHRSLLCHFDRAFLAKLSEMLQVTVFPKQGMGDYVCMF